MPPVAPLLRAFPRRLLAAGAILALAASLLIGLGDTASAATTRTWTLSGVTFADGGQMTGSFDLDDSGQMSAVHIVTSGGDTGSFGTSTTYDASNSGAYDEGSWYAIVVNSVTRYVALGVGDVSNAADGDVVALDTSMSWECMNCYPRRMVVSGSIVAGPLAPPVVTGTPTVTGTAEVGQTLTGDDSGVTATPGAATKSYQWLRDGAEIPGASSATYTLTNDDAGHTVAFQVGASEPGYADAIPVTSAAVGPVSGGVITLPTPVISGTAVVDGTLSATLPDGLDPADAGVAWQWFRGATAVGDSSTYTPTADDAGEALTVTATATKDYFASTSESAETASVAKATFADAPAPTISGTVKVGETLVADPGTVTPAADELAYQWYAGGNPVDGATDSTFVLGSAQRHTTMTVQVTATKAGYDDASGTSEPTADVATELAPDLSFTSADHTIRRGEATELSWSSTDADTATASGTWSGSMPLAGTSGVTPTSLGDNVYVLSATNTNGTTTSQVVVSVRRPAHQLAVSVPAGLHLAGKTVDIAIDGLEADEPYAIRIGGVQVVTGRATGSGPMSRTVTVPASAGERPTAVTVTGSEADRTGTTTMQVVVTKGLGIDLAKHAVRKRHHEWVTVTGLAAGEHVKVAYRGRTISPPDAHADQDGVYRAVIRVGRLAGVKTVTARGEFYARRATATFRVTRH